MRTPAKATVVTIVSLVTLAFGIAPVAAIQPSSTSFEDAAAVQPVAPTAQTLSASSNSVETQSLDTLLADVESTADFAMIGCYGGYTTNLPVAELLGGKAWVVHTFDGAPLHPVHGGPARLLVPHLYFWKSAKWVNSITLMPMDRQGFWERLGYHDLGDPWREQRYQGD